MSQYKVLGSRFLYYEESEIDFHADACRLVQYGRRNCMNRDRFNFWNKYSRVSFSEKVDPIYSSTDGSKSFEEVVIEMIDDMLKKYEHINLLWSGGLDSDVIATALYIRSQSNEKVGIYCTQDSIDAFPECYAILKTRFKIVVCTPESLLDTAMKGTGKKDILLDGEPGTLFCERATPDDPLKDMPYKDALVELNKEGRFYSNFDDFSNLVEEYLNMFDVKIKTYTDLKCMLSYGFRLVTSPERIVFDCLIIDPTFDRVTSFFYNDERLEKWFLSNFDDIIRYQLSGEKKNYKKYSKDFIYKYLKIERVYELMKDKRTSFIFDTMCPKFDSVVGVSTDTGYMFFERPPEFVRHSRNRHELIYNKEFSNFIKHSLFYKN